MSLPSGNKPFLTAHGNIAMANDLSLRDLSHIEANKPSKTGDFETLPPSLRFRFAITKL
jgi:hypothetical protein